MRSIASILFCAFALLPTAAFAAERNGGDLLLRHANIRRLLRIQRNQPTPKPRTVPTRKYDGYVRMGRRIVPLSTRIGKVRYANEVMVTRVIDGSVFIVERPNKMIREVRMLGTNAPLLYTETVPQCFAQESKNMLEGLILGKIVNIQKEEGYNRDSYRRLVRVVNLGNMNVNNWMIRNGAAFSDQKHPHSRKEQYDLSEADAREDDLGMWSWKCDYEIDDEDQLQILDFN